eukprot:TRINITY_DN4287_c0_g1_i1.p4 TRINITY_DN4287_c0_g1~~TRINITY_DN4287_c0_g1_i1.p4  ORF type:complete len:64 (-),score=4.66 TRINITY_DN4287_c0_g1_i1:40-231(-)
MLAYSVTPTLLSTIEAYINAANAQEEQSPASSAPCTPPAPGDKEPLVRRQWRAKQNERKAEAT